DNVREDIAGLGVHLVRVEAHLPHGQFATWVDDDPLERPHVGDSVLDASLPLADRCGPRHAVATEIADTLRPGRGPPRRLPTEPRDTLLDVSGRLVYLQLDLGRLVLDV